MLPSNFRALSYFLDRDTPAWLVSLVLHMVGLLVVASLDAPLPQQEDRALELVALAPELPEMPETIKDFVFDAVQQDQVGALSTDGQEVALEMAPQLSSVPDIPAPHTPVALHGMLAARETLDLVTGLHANTNFVVKGAAGVGTTGAAGAVDRLTHEILMSLDERDTLVVWLFDQSASLIRQRQSIHDRLARIYDELGVIQQSARYPEERQQQEPLLTSLVAFGKDVRLLTDRPISDVDQIKDLVQGIPRDDTGIENVFSAITMTANKYRRLRARGTGDGHPERNVMLIVFTDEVGDDQGLLDATVDLCRRYEMPVYVVGVPAPFGRDKAIVKWVDPDPSYDQTPMRGEVDQGPESVFPERLKLKFTGTGDQLDLIDSGFGPYALTRLCYETGGIYFTVHPNRADAGRVRWGEVEAFSSHLSHFFDPEVMRKYQPDYVSLEEYHKRVRANRARESLLAAARQSWLAPMDDPRLRFVKRSEAELANALTEAQKDAAKLEPQVDALYQILKRGEADRRRESSLRWQAGYDLAMGRVLAMKVRTETYNAMLAMAKRGMPFQDASNNTWQLSPADAIVVGSQLEKQAKQAREYLERVTIEHPNTPWALLAQHELSQPFGWQWDESHTDLAPRRSGSGSPNNRPPSDDQRRMLERPKPKRPVPKL